MDVAVGIAASCAGSLTAFPSSREGDAAVHRDPPVSTAMHSSSASASPSMASRRAISCNGRQAGSVFGKRNARGMTWLRRPSMQRNTVSDPEGERQPERRQRYLHEAKTEDTHRDPQRD